MNIPKGYIQEKGKRILRDGSLMIGLFGLSEFLSQYHLFERIEHLDISFHFLGGFLSALFVSGAFEKCSKQQKLGLISGIFISWEIYEALASVPDNVITSPGNTLQDIAMDTLGASIYLLRDKIKNRLSLVLVRGG